jgi:hypothetical protein
MPLAKRDVQTAANVIRERTPDARLDEDTTLRELHKYDEHNGDIPCARCPICGSDMFQSGYMGEVCDASGTTYETIYATPVDDGTYYCRLCYKAAKLVVDDLNHTTLDRFEASAGER